MKKICLQCKKSFPAKHGNRDKFCSTFCFGLSKRGKPVIRSFTKKIREKIRKARRLQAPPRPRGSKLTEEHKEKLRKPRRLRATVGGYIVLYNKTHPFRGKNNIVFGHRIVVEKFIGRYLRRDEIVHHINEVKTDNRLSNLFICSRGYHAFLHKSKPCIRVKSNLKLFRFVSINTP